MLDNSETTILIHNRKSAEAHLVSAGHLVFIERGTTIGALIKPYGITWKCERYHDISGLFLRIIPDPRSKYLAPNGCNIINPVIFFCVETEQSYLVDPNVVLTIVS